MSTISLFAAIPAVLLVLWAAFGLLGVVAAAAAMDLALRRIEAQHQAAPIPARTDERR